MEYNHKLISHKTNQLYANKFIAGVLLWQNILKNNQFSIHVQLLPRYFNQSET